MLNAHLDTVGVEGMDRPHEPRIEGGRLYGRGAYDMKSGLAAILLAGARAAKAGLPGDVIVACVADEEVASLGTEAVLGSWRADASIVTEPTELDVCIAHRGFAWAEIETHGRAAHGSRPELGEDAIVKMGPILTRLGELDQKLRAHPTHPLLEGGSIHASLISGGQELSSYPAGCRLQLERRTIPGETREMLERELGELVGGEAGFQLGISREPFEVGEDEPIVLKKGASGFFGTNLASILLTQGVDSVVLCGATTSGCIRATAIDLLQYGWPTLVPRECVGDRAQAPHEANLFDIQAKYADVVSVDDALAYLETVPERVGVA